MCLKAPRIRDNRSSLHGWNAMKINRRVFLKSGGLSLLGLGAVPPFLQRLAFSNTSGNKKILITIFQRGAADALNIVVPFGEKLYFNMRPSIAIPQPRQGDSTSALDLDGFFGFHPSLQPIKPIYDQGKLAVIHAVGSPDSTRSHFDAQDFMESGTPGIKSTTDGWLNRHLQTKAGFNETPFRGCRHEQPAAANSARNGASPGFEQFE